MAISWSRIHAVLGLSPTPLTYEMLQSAVEHRVREAVDLDWKGALISADEDPNGRQKALEARRKEFTKDVAAMANTQGGVIVYGVSDVEEEADAIVPVSLGERERQRLASWANTIRPWISGIVIEEFTADDDKSAGILVVSVPASPDVPHIVGERNGLGVPYRDGSHTLWMSESQLERAYRDRFARQAREEAALDEQMVEARDQLDLESGRAWIIIAARPLVTHPRLVPERPTKLTVSETLWEALVLAAELQPETDGRYPMLRELSQHAVDNPRVGLRRWVASDRTFGQPDSLSNYVHVELHHDASSTVAFGIERWIQPGDNEPYHRISVPHLGSAILDAVALVTAHARRRCYSGRLLVRLDLVRGDVQPFGAVDNRTFGGFMVSGHALVGQSTLLQQPRRVEVELAADDSLALLRQAAHQLESDLVHQFGIPHGIIRDT
ncbi:MAG TPA: ATP-binding protein [Actinokineospora sp.]|jgi:hypothetical protein|nr:ATP-binding protein [Actinokineospora sp.]